MAKVFWRQTLPPCQEIGEPLSPRKLFKAAQCYLLASIECVSFQVRNPHNYMADFQAELPLYEQSGALVEFLLEYSEANSTPSGGLTWSLVEALAVTMYEYGIVDTADVALAQVRLYALRKHFARSMPRPAVLAVHTHRVHTSW